MNDKLRKKIFKVFETECLQIDEVEGTNDTEYIIQTKQLNRFLDYVTALKTESFTLHNNLEKLLERECKKAELEQDNKYKLEIEVCINHLKTVRNGFTPAYETGMKDVIEKHESILRNSPTHLILVNGELKPYFGKKENGESEVLNEDIPF